MGRRLGGWDGIAGRKRGGKGKDGVRDRLRKKRRTRKRKLRRGGILRRLRRKRKTRRMVGKGLG